MKPTEFLQAILPSDGHYAVVGIKNKKVKQVLLEDLSNIKQIVKAALNNSEDVYFGCSSYATPSGRTKANVLHIKAFWIDLDCGEGTAYETKQDGFAALRALCKATELPRPFVVDSGRGLHVYWPLNEPILTEVWSVYAKKLMELCAASGLVVKDPGCSTDPARILRIPGTFNFKNPDDPLPVVIITEGFSSDWANLKHIIETACGTKGINGFHPAVALPKKKTKLDPVTAALMGNKVSVFSTIAKKSLKGEGCEQIRYALENPADTSEPLWRAVLSVAQVCTDRDVAIHKVSKGHPDYDHAATEAKAAATVGPITCAKFAEVCGGERCAECSYKSGRIVGPVALGREIARAAPPEKLSFVNADGEKIETSVDVELIEKPELPFPYFRGVQGGIYLPAPPVAEGAEPGEDLLVYEHDLDVIRRIKDPEKGEVLIMTHRRPKDGTEEIIIPLADALSQDRIRDKLGYHGVAAHKERMNKIGTYIVSAVRNMQHLSSAEPARSQMGWTEDRTGIVWGRTMYTANGPQYCPPAAKSSTVAGIMKTTGSYAAWEEIASRYAAEGFEQYATCVLMGFGSMLNYYTHEDPVWVHMVSSESGTGKTTLTNVINSIWGDPLAMKLTVKDTVNALEKRRVIFNSFAICQDEITNLPPEKVSELAYAQSQGREKLRLSSASTEIANTDRRNNTLITNGNRHVSDVISAFKTNAAGEFARMVEIQFAPLATLVSGADHFGKILTNYGHAGPRYAQWLVRHEAELEDRVSKWRLRFEQDMHSVSSERNWVGLAATTFAAGEIVQQELGMLLAYDLEKLYANWLVHMESIRSTVNEAAVSHDNVLGDFINENYGNILIIDENVHAVGAASSTSAALFGAKHERDSRNKLLIRHEKKAGKLFIAQSALKEYCNKRAHSFTDLIAYYHKSAQFSGLVTKRMGAGTSVLTSPIKTLSFHVTGELGDMLEGV